jgi:membrane-associated phospholipid phosphatase
MRRVLLVAPLLLLAEPAHADNEALGTGVAIALPVAAAGIAAYKRDWNGVVDLGLTTIATVGTAYALKQVVRERRPDGSDFKSFPSDTTALAASGSSFLWARYGWQYGVPALAATAFVGWTRVDADKHHWYDVAASEAISIAYAAIFTPRYKGRYVIYSQLSASPDSAYLRLAMDF